MIEALADYAVRNCKMLHRLKIWLSNSSVYKLSMALFQTLEEHGNNI